MQALSMTIERARAIVLAKPWGIVDLRPWSSESDARLPTGEIWFEREEGVHPTPKLLLKLLFTSQPLSIQVHPGDAYARSIGLGCGKTEAWYVLSADEHAQVALGLKTELSAAELAASVDDGSIEKQVAWRNVVADEVVLVPAGTIHAIGAGLVLAEIQQRADATFRLFDFGRERELHIGHDIAVADRGPAIVQPRPSRRSKHRRILADNAHFVFERFDLPPASDWFLEAVHETWLLVILGSARVGSFKVVRGEALFAEGQCVNILSGRDGMACLAAYSGSAGPATHLLRRGPRRLHSKRAPLCGPAHTGSQ
jgi:mannose-6-phosphate isomerase